MKIRIAIFFSIMTLFSCKYGKKKNDFTRFSTTVMEENILLSRQEYANQLYGFWLGQCIANWTGLITEMDKIGNIGEIKTGDFYTRENWGKPDQPSIWGQGIPSALSPTIDFVFRDTTGVWGADDDTDIEYMYQQLMYDHKTSSLTPNQIQEGWLKHIRSKEENYLWVSNQRAFDLMNEGVLPPETGSPNRNEHYDMIDAQLTTEIFGFFAPGRTDIAIKIADLPIKTTARKEAEYISKFYVTMYSLASLNTSKPLNDRIHWMANEARKILPDSLYPAKMFDYVRKLYSSGISWEQSRDSIYARYQLLQKDGYDITSRNLYCNGCFAAGINFAASLISLFYGEGDFIKTIQIGSLAGWDSDNPTATWGGLIGFMIGKEGIERTFNRQFSNKFDIHRTRQNFLKGGIDTFENMAQKGLEVTNLVILKEMGGILDEKNDSWIIPIKKEY